MGRQPCCDKSGVKKGPWTAEEDKKLIKFILTNGPCCWRALPKLAGLRRCGKSCRLRWTNYLRPDLKRGLLTEAEEQIVIDLHARLGNRWSKIASKLPGRTDNEIKNHWNTHIKKKLIKQGIDPVTHEPLAKEIQANETPSSQHVESLDKSVCVLQIDQNGSNDSSANDKPKNVIIQTVCDDEKLLSELLEVSEPLLLNGSNWDLSNDDEKVKDCNVLDSWEDCTTWLMECQDFGVNDFGFDFFNKVEMIGFPNTFEIDQKGE